MTYVLHYAPDNASLIPRMALEHRGLPYRIRLVDRAAREQESAAYRALNPNGLIPVLETPQGPLFETGAILLWLSDRHGGLGPGPDDPGRVNLLKWLFFLSNTVHPALRMRFYPDKYIAPGAVAELRAGLARHLNGSLHTLEAVAATRPDWLHPERPGALHFYIGPLLRWAALYPAQPAQDWFQLATYPALQQICAHLETLPCTHRLQKAEGLGMTPFTNPSYPLPPEGSAT
ncbi:MAG: glutathione S-transferase family protein [Sulfitobacter sp.]|nr:glutathione S-transferase family protein [Sulfitobacter sp.]